MSGGGRRIKLDLSNFVRDGGSHRWMYLPDQSFSTVSDVIERFGYIDGINKYNELIELIIKTKERVQSGV